MIHDTDHLGEVLDEISEWDLQKRRDYIAEIGKAYGPESAQQLKDGLTARWNGKDRA